MIKVGFVPNNETGFKIIRELRENVRRENRWSRVHSTVRIYGRCRDKKKAFAEVGRYHSSQSNSNTIYSLKSPEAKYCYGWAVYILVEPKKVKSQAYPDGVSDVNRY